MESYYDFISRYSYLKKNIYNILGPFILKDKALSENTKRVFDYIDITDKKLIISILSILFDKGKLENLRGYQYIEKLKLDNNYKQRINESMPIFKNKMEIWNKDGERDFFLKYLSQMNSEFVLSYLEKCNEDIEITEEQFLLDLFRYLFIFTGDSLVLETKGREIINFYRKIATMTGKTNNEMYHVLSNSELRYLFNGDEYNFLRNLALEFDLEYILDVAAEIEKWNINNVKKLVK